MIFVTFFILSGKRQIALFFSHRKNRASTMYKPHEKIDLPSRRLISLGGEGCSTYLIFVLGIEI